jgi:hypothetical protein
LAVVVLLVGVMAAASAQAKLTSKAVVRSTANVVKTSAGVRADPNCCAPCPKCCPRCISYKHHRTLRRTCCGCETRNVVLQVYDPCCCCCVDVPVCIPACCCDAPCVSARGGLIARSVTTFKWNCGYKVIVVMGPRGDLLVHSYGR